MSIDAQQDSGDDGGFWKALEIHKEALESIQAEDAASFKEVENPLSLCKENGNASKALNRLLRVRIKSAMQSIVIECDQIETADIPDGEKIERYIKLTIKSEILIRRIQKSNNDFMQSLIQSHNLPK